MFSLRTFQYLILLAGVSLSQNLNGMAFPCPFLSASALAKNYKDIPATSTFDRRPTEELIPNRDELLAAADAKAENVVAGGQPVVDSVPPSLLAKMRNKTVTYYVKLEARYGKGYAIAVLSAGVLGEIALPFIPGSGFVTALPPLLIAELHFRLRRGRTEENPTSPPLTEGMELHSSPGTGEILSTQDISALALLMRLEIEMMVYEEISEYPAHLRN